MVDKRKHPIITERHNPGEKDILPTTRARKSLYNMIAVFRKDAAQSDNPQISSLFNYAADMIARLARLFKAVEDDPDQTKPSVMNKSRDN